MSLIAVLQIGSLGDTIVSIPVLRSLRDFIPTCSEYLLISRFDTKLKVMPNHVFDMAWKSKYQINYRPPGEGSSHIFSVAKLLAQLRYYRPAHCVYLMPTLRSKRQIERDRLFFKIGGVKELHGFDVLDDDETSLKELSPLQTTEAFRRFYRIWGAEAATKFPQYSNPPLLLPGEGAIRRVTEWVASHRRHPARPLVAICPYSNIAARNISAETIRGLLYRLETEFNVEAVLLGGHKDTADAAFAIAQSGTGLNACGLFSVEESAALLKACRLVIATESGPMHLAGAVGVPAVVTFSRVNKYLNAWFPLSSDSTILYRDVECAGCVMPTCPIEGHPCMSGIKIDHVLAAVASKLNHSCVLPAKLEGTQVVEWTSGESICR